MDAQHGDKYSLPVSSQNCTASILNELRMISGQHPLAGNVLLCHLGKNFVHNNSVVDTKITLARDSVPSCFTLGSNLLVKTIKI